SIDVHRNSTDGRSPANLAVGCKSFMMMIFAKVCPAHSEFGPLMTRHRQAPIVLLLSTLSTALSSDVIPQVGRFELFETALTASGPYVNPYVELTAAATLIPPNGRRPRSIPLFWDGASTWKLRFSPDQLGRWTWTVASRDPGLNGKSGAFEAVASN